MKYNADIQKYDADIQKAFAICREKGRTTISETSLDAVILNA
jgi:hypothetical protein